MMRPADAPAVLAAAGSIARPETLANPSNGARLRLVAEIGLLFVAAPLALDVVVHDWRVPLLAVLPPLLVGCILYLVWDPTFVLRRELTRGVAPRDLVSILAMYLVAAGVVAAVVFITDPAAFLAFPRQRPTLWLTVIVFYPLLSALAQELVFRTFFFHRYGALFTGRLWLAVAVNGALFGFAHIIFGNAVSVALSGALGVLLAWRYATTRSLWAAFLEHTLYGWLVFTVGLGAYFFTGVSSF